MINAAMNNTHPNGVVDEPTKRKRGDDRAADGYFGKDWDSAESGATSPLEDMEDMLADAFLLSDCNGDLASSLESCLDPVGDVERLLFESGSADDADAAISAAFESFLKDAEHDEPLLKQQTPSKMKRRRSSVSLVMEILADGASRRRVSLELVRRLSLEPGAKKRRSITARSTIAAAAASAASSPPPPPPPPPQPLPKPRRPSGGVGGENTRTVNSQRSAYTQRLESLATTMRRTAQSRARILDQAQETARLMAMPTTMMPPPVGMVPQPAASGSSPPPPPPTTTATASHRSASFTHGSRTVRPPVRRANAARSQSMIPPPPRSTHTARGTVSPPPTHARSASFTAPPPSRNLIEAANRLIEGAAPQQLTSSSSDAPEQQQEARRNLGQVSSSTCAVAGFFAGSRSTITASLEESRRQLREHMERMGATMM